MDRGDLTADWAFEALRTVALRNGRPLRKEAEAVDASTKTAARRATPPSPVTGTP